MKITDIFKKGRKNESKVNVQTLDKKQLEKVIGGAEDIGTIPMAGGVLAGASKQTQGATFGEAV